MQHLTDTIARKAMTGPANMMTDGRTDSADMTIEK
jgi:hypothetical protein